MPMPGLHFLIILNPFLYGSVGTAYDRNTTIFIASHFKTIHSLQIDKNNYALN